MSATKEFLYDVQEYVWLIEFAPLSFRQRGRARELMVSFWTNDGSREVDPDEFNGWYGTAYELIEEQGGIDWACDKEAQRLLSWVKGF